MGAKFILIKFQNIQLKEEEKLPPVLDHRRLTNILVSPILDHPVANLLHSDQYLRGYKVTYSPIQRFVLISVTVV